MLARMPASIFAEWQAYYAVEPWGEEMAELRNGILCATVVNSQPQMSKHKRKAISPDKFMPVATAKKKALQALRIDRKAVRDRVLEAFRQLKERQDAD